MCIYICCSVESLSKICRFLPRKSVQKLRRKSVQDFCLLVFPSFIVFLVVKKTQKVLWGAKIMFLQVVEVSKKGLHKKNAFLVLVFFMLEQTKEKR